MTEEWRRSISWPSYEVSGLGRVRRAVPARGARVGRVLAQYTDPDGYKHVGLWRNRRRQTVKVHHLVLEVFGPPRPSPKHVARHGPGGSGDNRPGNLCWGTYAENEADKLRDGTNRYAEGEQTGSAKLTVAQVIEIRTKYGAGGVTHRALAQQYGVDHGTIGRIIRGQKWRSVPHFAAGTLTADPALESEAG
jgi:hypothetical protein